MEENKVNEAVSIEEEITETNEEKTSSKREKDTKSFSNKSEKDSDSKNESDKPELVTKNKLLEYGVHYGHQKQWWNPKMAPFIQYTKNGTHIINLHKTIVFLQNAYNAIYKIAEAKKTILFVGSTKQSSNTTKLNAERVGALYIDNRWLGGLLTNFKTIKNSINKLKNLERLAKDNFEGYTKKEGILLQRELDKLNANLGGIKNIKKLPDAIFVASVKNDAIVIKEAKKLKIPVIGIVDTNVDPSLVEFPIPANDDSLKSESLLITILADAIAAAQQKPQLAAFKGEDVKVLGLDENYVKKPRKEYKPRGNGRPYNNSYNKNYDNKNRYGSSNGSNGYKSNKPYNSNSTSESTQTDKSKSNTESKQEVK